MAVANQQDLRKQFGNGVPHVRDKGGECGEVRLAVSGDSDKQYILAAGRFDLAAVDDATAVGQQDDLDEDGRVEGGCAFVVVFVAGMEGG